MSYKTSYSVKSKENFIWLTALKTDKHSVYCELRCKDLKIDGGCISQIKAHAKGKTHENNAKSNKGQITFTSSFNLSLSKLSDIALTPKEQALQTVASNSFSSADRDNKSLQLMFPDSEIAQSYEQANTKIKYIIQYGIAPYADEFLSKDFGNKPFAFIFYETTTSQIQKQVIMYDFGHLIGIKFQLNIVGPYSLVIMMLIIC